MKNWKNISDMELDGLFRDAADKHLPEYDEASWQRMEQLLDKKEDEKGGFITWRNGLWLLGFLLFFGGAGWYGYDKLKEVSKSPAQTEVEKSPLDQLSSEKTDISESQMNNTKPALSDQRSLEIAEERVTAETGNISKSNKPEAYVSIISGNKKSDRKNENDALGKINLAEIIETEKGTAAINTKEGESFTVEDQAIAGNNFFQFQKNKDPQLLEIGNWNKMPEFDAPDKVHTEMSPPPQRGLAFRLMVSPDFSFVPQYGIKRIGHNLGFLLEYRFNQRWAVQAGAIKSQKYYLTDGDEYPWPARWGERPSSLNRIDASCNMMDFPVNLRYNITEGRSMWFGQLGVTNYLMIKEKYDFIYASSYGDKKYNSWEGKTGFYSIGEVNISAGRDQQIARNLNIQIEPFLKIPLQRVGYGKVKIATFGVFLSTRIPLSRH